MTWQLLEKRVRTIASYIWDCAGQAEHVNGVDVDCVLKLRPDHWILIEITQETTLSKLRTDLAKFASLRHYLFQQNTYAECFFVCESCPPPSLVETGQGANVTVYSVEDLQRKFLDYERYHFVRSQKRFGSAVDPFSGEKDQASYVPVKYTEVSTGKRYSVNDLAELLLASKRIVMLGNYGTGKSRCMQELFTQLLSFAKRRTCFPLSIDLRDNWGTRRANELIRRHFDDLGLNSQGDAAVKVLGVGALVLLLDGFDEIGSQAWSDNPSRLRDIRAESLLGVKHLISTTTGGIIVTGREHYFNSDQEMFQCLGLHPTESIVIRCENEFTDAEMQDYLKIVVGNVTLPPWLPRRPLICQIIAGMDPKVLTILSDKDFGEFEFWGTLMTSICEREARINVALEATTIRRVLRRISRVTRSKIGDVGPISMSEINRAFEEITGSPPVDESAVMLQRLPGLGRIASETTDRQFIDEYLLDGLRAEDLQGVVMLQDETVRNQRWTNPLRTFGLQLIIQDMACDPTAYLQYLGIMKMSENHILAGDIVSALVLSSDATLDCGGFQLRNAHIAYLDLSRTSLKGLFIEESIIEKLDISNAQVENVVIRDCVIHEVYGISAQKGLPDWMRGNTIEAYQAVDTVARIRQANLGLNQRVFLTFIKKLFFQPGAGRKEEALLRGLGASTDSRAARKILKLLIAGNVIERFKGNEGWVYSPNRRYTRRMDEILTQLTLSTDPLWVDLDSI